MDRGAIDRDAGIPGAMDCDAKATMLEDCVLRAHLTAGGELEVDLHRHVREETRAM